MLADYFESLLGDYRPVDGVTGLDAINYDWLILALLVIVSFHCVMLLLTAILRRVVGR